MVATATHETPAIDRTACPSTGGHGTKHYRAKHGCTCPDAAADTRRLRRAAYRRELRRHARPDVHGEVFRPALGYARMLQACAVRGFGAEDLAARLGMTASRVRQLRRPAYPTVTRATADRITRVTHLLHERHAPPVDAPGSSRGHDRLRAYAARQGWVPLGAWEDIHDPHEKPDVRVLRRGAARMSTADFGELVDQGEHIEHIAARAGLTVEAAQRRADRHRARQAVLEAPSDPAAAGPRGVNTTRAGSPAGADREEGTAA